MLQFDSKFSEIMDLDSPLKPIILHSNSNLFMNFKKGPNSLHGAFGATYVTAPPKNDYALEAPF